MQIYRDAEKYDGTQFKVLTCNNARNENLGIVNYPRGGASVPRTEHA